MQVDKEDEELLGEELPDKKLAKKSSTGVTRTVLKQGLGKKLYNWLSSDMKRILCYRYPEKYAMFNYPWHNKTFAELIRFLKGEEKEALHLDEINPEKLNELITDLKNTKR